LESDRTDSVLVFYLYCIEMGPKCSANKGPLVVGNGPSIAVQAKETSGGPAEGLQTVWLARTPFRAILLSPHHSFLPREGLCVSKPILVVGSISQDLVVTSARLPFPGETLIGTNYATFFGGKGANQAVAAARLGAVVAMIGAVGDDAVGPSLRNGLASAGVDAQFLKTVPGASGVAVIFHAENGENAIVIAPGSNFSLLPADIDLHRALVAGAGMVLLQMEVPMQTVEHAIAVAAELHVPVMLDPAPARPLPDHLLRQVTWLTPNETEQRVLLGGDAVLAPAQTAQALLARGVQNVALKLGKNGVYIAGHACPAQHIPGFSVPVVDTTAAGDAFNAAFACWLLQCHAPAEAAGFAVAASALSVTRAGAQPSLPTLQETQAFLRLQHTTAVP
jgi:ribokinase